MIFELVNPSDAVTFECEDVRVACVAVLVLGEGKYGLTDTKGDSVLPLFMFGGMDPVNAWFKEQHDIDDVMEWMNAHLEEMATFLDSMVYGSVKERQLFLDAVSKMNAEDAADFKEKWFDQKRSSMNNIGRACAAYAAGCRKKAEELNVASGKA